MANHPVPIPGAQARAADQAAAKTNALWYTFAGIGRAYLVRRGSVAAGDADASGVHGYGTIEAAYANPNSDNTFTQATISQWDAWSSLPAGGGVAGVVETRNITAPTTPGGHPVISTPQNPTTAAASGFWGSFPWLRIGETVLGLLLIAVAVANMTDSVPVATKIAKALS